MSDSWNMFYLPGKKQPFTTLHYRWEVSKVYNNYMHFNKAFDL